MMNFCPLCGARVTAGATVCQNCGESLAFVVQMNRSNTNATSVKEAGIKKKNSMLAQTVYIENNDLMAETNPSLKYNDDPEQGKLKPHVFEEEISIPNYADDLSEQEGEIEFSEQDGKLTGVQTASVMQEMSKYKIVTQPFDKKTGFNAKELEEKLNMYAKLGYHIVANTMICQPGQDFFALMEKNQAQGQVQQSPVIPLSQQDDKSDKM